MLGLDNLATALVFWLCFAASLLCVGYGAKNWNNAGKPDLVTAKNNRGTADDR